jgi:hypothetical protein
MGRFLLHKTRLLINVEAAKNSKSAKPMLLTYLDLKLANYQVNLVGHLTWMLNEFVYPT